MFGIVLLGAYVVALIILGWWGMKKTKNLGDFFLGGRSLGPWMSAFAYGTTYFSAVLFIGYGGKLGWGYHLHTMWIVFGNVIVGTMLAWLVLAKRTRLMTEKLNVMTMPAFLGERYKSPTLKMAAALLVFIFLVPYSASVYMGLSYLFEQALGISYSNALIIMAVMTAVYLMMGGYFAVMFTDFLMGIIMICGVVAMLYVLLSKAGGLFHAIDLLSVCPAPALAPAKPGAIPGWLTLACLALITSFGPWGLPQMVQKFYSIKHVSQIKRAMIISTLFALLMTFGGYFGGAMTHLNLPDSPSALLKVDAPLAAGDYTPASELPMVTDAAGKKSVDWDRWIPSFLSRKLPGWMMVVIALLVFSASMSTLSSLVLVSSGAIAMDLYAGAINPKIDKKYVLIMMRVLCGLFVLLSLVIAMKKPAYIITLMVISWGAISGAFIGPYLYGLFWRRANVFGAGAGMISGVGVAVVLYWFLGQPGVPLGGAIAMLLPLIVIPVVSLMTKPMPAEFVSDLFDKPADSAPK